MATQEQGVDNLLHRAHLIERHFGIKLADNRAKAVDQCRGVRLAAGDERHLAEGYELPRGDEEFWRRLGLEGGMAIVADDSITSNGSLEEMRTTRRALVRPVA